MTILSLKFKVKVKVNILYSGNILYTFNTMCNTSGKIIMNMLLSNALQSKIILSSMTLIIHVPEYKKNTVYIHKLV